jgi:hypothetical protein
MTPKEQRELKEATAAISPSAQLSSATPVQQSPMPAKAATSTGSRISFVGHSPNFAIWVFNVNGKELVARNLSTQSPLQLRFEGYWDKPTFTPINTSGFKITDSTDTNMIWQWAGKQYTSWWKVVYDDEEDPDSTVYLNFGPPVPYTGPARSPVGNEVKTTPPVQGGGDTQTRQTPSGGGIYPSGSWNDFPQPTPTPTPTPAPEPAKGDLLSLAIKLGSVYMLLK